MFPHFSVLLQEVTEAFQSDSLSIFVDGTLGAGGHAEAILKAHPEIKTYIGIDQDLSALEIARERLAPWKDKVIFKHGNFSEIDRVLKEEKISSVQGILVDLGVSSMQLDRAERGFSFSREGPLDMRMNTEEGLTAADIVNTWSEQELGRIFREYGEEKKWRIAAQAIVQARQQQSIKTTPELVAVLKPFFSYHKKGINPLTLIFQALRICVNRELEVLEVFMPKAAAALAPQGRVAVISFHSLEDRIVKRYFQTAVSDKMETAGLGNGLFRSKDPTMVLVNRKPLIASEEETRQNPRSRSAKLRIAEKL